MKLGQVINIIQSKREVGSTFFTCNLAGALANEGKKVLILDFGNDSNIMEFFNFDKYNDMSKVLKKEISLQSAKLIYQENRNLTVIKAQNKTTYNKKFIKSIFQQIKKTYDYILIDIKEDSKKETFSLLEEYIQKNVLVVEPEQSSIEQVSNILKTLDNEADTSILINKFDFNNEEEEHLLISIEDMYSILKLPYLGIVEYTNEEKTKSPSFHKPYSDLHMAFERISKRIINNEYLNKITNVNYVSDFSMEILYKNFDISEKRL